MKAVFRLAGFVGSHSLTSPSSISSLVQSTLCTHRIRTSISSSISKTTTVGRPYSSISKTTNASRNLLPNTYNLPAHGFTAGYRHFQSTKERLLEDKRTEGLDCKMPAINRKLSCTSCGSPQRTVSDGPRKPFMIGVAGGTASGKSTVCKTIMDQLGQSDVHSTEKQVVALTQDSFYRELDPHEIALANKGKFNFDHPDAFDVELLESCLTHIMEGRMTKIPVYDFKTNARVPGEFTTIYPSDVVLVEGILVFYYPKIRDSFHLKLFVDTDADTRLARRVLRDIEERGRDLEHVLTQYTTLVKPAFEEFCIPTKKFADVIVPRGAENTVAIDLIVQHIQDIIWRSNGLKGDSPLTRSRSNSDSRIR